MKFFTPKLTETLFFISIILDVRSKNVATTDRKNSTVKLASYLSCTPIFTKLIDQPVQITSTVIESEVNELQLDDLSIGYCQQTTLYLWIKLFTINITEDSSSSAVGWKVNDPTYIFVYIILLVLGDPSTANCTPAKQVEHTEYTVIFF